MLRLLVMLLGLAACSTDQSELFNPTPLSYQDRVPIPLAVDEVVIESRFVAPDDPAHVEGSLPMSPESAALSLLRQRLWAAGGAGAVFAGVEDASIVEEVIGPFGGPDRASDPAAQQRLRGRVKVRLVEVDAAGLEAGTVTTAVTRAVSVPSEATRAERQAIAHTLVRDLVDDLDNSLVESIYQNLAVVPRAPSLPPTPEASRGS